MMRRTKEWWAWLDRYERAELVFLEREQHHSYRSGYLPDDCSECGGCSSPTISGGLCTQCGNRLEQLIAKANKGE